MGFFKEFKEDLSQAVNELSDDAGKLAAGVEEDNNGLEDDVMVDTLDEKVEDVQDANNEQKDLDNSEETFFANLSSKIESEAIENNILEAENDETKESITDETAIITPGLKIIGDIESSGSIELLGKVSGNVTCKGKLVVSGTIEGNTSSSEFFADKAHITGDIHCDGSAKVGDGTVIVGDLIATSAVIAGAIKGDIDVHGPVIVDTSAIVMGNIKSKLVQINNGAVIEGYCSQCYSDNSPKNFFGEK